MKIKKTFYTFPLHTFLLGPILVFFLYVHNYEELHSNSIWRSLFFTIGISAILYLINYFLLQKKQSKTAVLTTILTMFLFSYGIIYDFLEKLYFNSHWPFANIHRYLISFFFALFILLFIYIRKTKRTFPATTYSLNIFVGCILLFNVVILTRKTFTEKIINNERCADNPVQYLFSQKNDSLPDIYYIILDAYANDSVLSSFYNYPKNQLTNFLRQKNFYRAAESHTNYLFTSGSLISSLNFSYPDSLLPSDKITYIYKNKVCWYLKSKGYKIVHLRSGYTVTRENYYTDVLIPLDAINEFERTLLKYTIFRLDDLIGYTHYLLLNEQLKKIYDILPVEGPKFVFIHIVSPHPPYICDEFGKFTSNKKAKDTWWEPKKDYLSQLKFINMKMEEYINKIMSTGKRKVIIIIQSDHGPFMKNNSFKNIYEARSKILNAYYIPYSFREKLYQSITPVNTFRIIFNGLFQDSLPLLPDIPFDSLQLKNIPQMKNFYYQKTEQSL